MCPHSNDTLVLPFSSFPRSRFTALQEGSLHFGRDDVQERRIASHSLSHRFVDPSCAFGAPLLQGATRIVNITPLVPKHATYLPDESPSALAYRHPERTKTLYV